MDREIFNQGRVNLFTLKNKKALESFKRLVEASDGWKGGFQRHSKGGKRRGDLSYMDGSSKNLQKEGRSPPRSECNQRTWKQRCLLFGFN